MFGNLLSSMGLGGQPPKINTQLEPHTIYPGQPMRGTTYIQGGSQECKVDGLFLALSTKVSSEEYGHTITEFARFQISGPFVLMPNQSHAVPFDIPMSPELPLTVMFGRYSMRDNGIFVQSILDIPFAFDSEDKDRIEIQPHPAMERILVAFERMGFELFKVDIEKGFLQGGNLPFFQEFEYRTYKTVFSSRINELEVSFIGRGDHCEVVLEIGKRGGFFHAGHDVFQRLQVPYSGFERENWENLLERMIWEKIGR